MTLVGATGGPHGNGRRPEAPAERFRKGVVTAPSCTRGCSSRRTSWRTSGCLQHVVDVGDDRVGSGGVSGGNGLNGGVLLRGRLAAAGLAGDPFLAHSGSFPMSAADL